MIALFAESEVIVKNNHRAELSDRIEHINLCRHGLFTLNRSRSAFFNRRDRFIVNRSHGLLRMARNEGLSPL